MWVYQALYPYFDFLFHFYRKCVQLVTVMMADYQEDLQEKGSVCIDGHSSL